MLWNGELNARKNDKKKTSSYLEGVGGLRICRVPGDRLQLGQEKPDHLRSVGWAENKTRQRAQVLRERQAPYTCVRGGTSIDYVRDVSVAFVSSSRRCRDIGLWALWLPASILLPPNGRAEVIADMRAVHPVGGRKQDNACTTHSEDQGRQRGDKNQTKIIAIAANNERTYRRLSPPFRLLRTMCPTGGTTKPKKINRLRYQLTNTPPRATLGARTCATRRL